MRLLASQPVRALMKHFASVDFLPEVFHLILGCQHLLNWHLQHGFNLLYRIIGQRCCHGNQIAVDILVNDDQSQFPCNGFRQFERGFQRQIRSDPSDVVLGRNGPVQLARLNHLQGKQHIAKHAAAFLLEGKRLVQLLPGQLAGLHQNVAKPAFLAAQVLVQVIRLYEAHVDQNIAQPAAELALALNRGMQLLLRNFPVFKEHVAHPAGLGFTA